VRNRSSQSGSNVPVWARAYPDGVSINDKNRYETEEVTKFIYGQRSLDEFQPFVDKLMNLRGSEEGARRVGISEVL
jgi:hypothetical protein